MNDYLRNTWILYRMQLVGVLRSRRVLVGLVLATLPPLMALIVVRYGPEELTADRIFATVSFFLSLQVVVPILSLALGSAVVIEEIENRTITYIFTRPVPRAAFLIGRWLATFTVIAALLVGSAAALVYVSGLAEGAVPENTGSRFIAASAAGGAVYSLLFAVLGIFLRRPMVVGLGYVFAFEGIFANAPGGTQSLSLQYYLRSVSVDAKLSAWNQLDSLGLTDLATPAEAWRTIFVLLVGALVVGAVAISRRQYVLSS